MYQEAASPASFSHQFPALRYWEFPLMAVPQSNVCTFSYANKIQNISPYGVWPKEKRFQNWDLIAESVHPQSQQVQQGVSKID